MIEAGPASVPQTLSRSTTDRMVAGVCGGIADYTGIDVRILRIALVLITCAGGAGVLAYLVAWLLVPADDEVDTWAERSLRKVRVRA